MVPNMNILATNKHSCVLKVWNEKMPNVPYSNCYGQVKSKSMKKNYKGEWFLPKSENKLSGELIFDDNIRKITLILFSEIYITGERIIKNQLIFLKNKNHFEIILGESDHLFTLYNCLLKSTESIGRLTKIVYNVEFAFSYVHLEDMNSLKINNIEAKFPFLSSFFDGFDSIKDCFNETEKTEYSKLLPITDNLNLKLVDNYNKNITNFNEGYELKYSKTIQFEYLRKKNFKEALKDIYTFSSLLSFVTKEPICFSIKIISIPIEYLSRFDKYFTIQNQSLPCFVMNYTQNESCDVNKTFLHQNLMLFSKFTHSEEILIQLIKNWYLNKNLKPIYDFYIDSENWFKGKSMILSNVMFNNKFLNIIQGIESYYDISNIEFNGNNENFTKNRQEVLNKIDCPKLNKWVSTNLKYPKTPTLVHKLDFLIEKFKDVILSINNIEPFIENYSIKAKDCRHKLSHGRIETTYQGRDFDKIYTFSKILLCFCILDSLNIEISGIKRICSSNENLNREFIKITSP